MLGSLNSLAILNANLATLMLAPFEIAADFANAVLGPYVEAIEEIKAEIVACAD
jgi:hypothetical protein